MAYRLPLANQWAYLRPSLPHVGVRVHVNGWVSSKPHNREACLGPCQLAVNKLCAESTARGCETCRKPSSKRCTAATAWLDMINDLAIVLSLDEALRRASSRPWVRGTPWAEAITKQQRSLDDPYSHHVPVKSPAFDVAMPSNASTGTDISFLVPR